MVTAREIMDRVPGLSLNGAKWRLIEYKIGRRSLESLFYPKGYILGEREGSEEWQSLGEQERLENMPVLGSWEQKQFNRSQRG